MSETDPAAVEANASDTGPASEDDSATTDPPTVEGLPVLGRTLSVLRDGLDFGDELAAAGDVVAYDALGERFVAVFDPRLVEEVLVTRADEFRKGDFEAAFGSLLAPNGVVFTEGEQWRRQRNLLQPAFTPARIRTFAETMVDDAATMTDGWADGSIIDAREELSTYALGVLTRTMFGVDLDAEQGTVVRDAVDAIGDRTTGASIVVPAWLPTPTKRRFRRAMADLDDFVETLVAERRDSADEHDDLLTTILAATFPDGTTMDADTVRDQLVTFLFAGHETSATALSYACWLLAGHPRVREHLDAELAAVCADRDPTFADLPELEYTERVVQETLRLYPPAYTLYRQPTVDTTLGGYAIPEDATLQLATYHVQRDERWWDDPEAFRPERWAADRDRPEYAYLPFGGGPRHCIGMRFASMEMKLALATVARRVRFERAGPVAPTTRITLDPGDVPLRVHRRASGPAGSTADE